jgi:hypothetical protein
MIQVSVEKTTINLHRASDYKNWQLGVYNLSTNAKRPWYEKKW